ncbi:hypothetical protein BCR32DRAFT_242772 [Anaeromyces robustus]|uniref:Uncharacterized protein n=1 Tax=Anaeromyces robustus TaxID=1754192 RepID=A0A1Y1XEI7_9FUNG|nr:hypothetical protein BCR32DRAFT_242772 [Anaeromyces robustus]|eukprot:ORX84159.1 hypothetical protein BCR32DRAFT_242772 [Anaeromyces robustus]
MSTTTTIMTTPRKKTSFHNLPNELVVKVFCYSKELPLLFTCKRYYYLWKYSSLIKALYLYQNSDKDEKELKSTIHTILKYKFLNEKVIEILERWFLSKYNYDDLKQIYTTCQLPKWLLKKPSLKFIKFLMDRGVSPTEPANRPLILACKKHNIELVKMLLAIGANPQQYNHGPLLIATKKKYNDIVLLLLQYYNKSKESREGINNALNIAIRQKNKTLIPVLVKFGDIDNRYIPLSILLS